MLTVISVARYCSLLILFSLPATSIANAQFGDVPTSEQASLDKKLKTAKKKCQQGDGEACYVIAELVRTEKVAYDGDEKMYAWTLTESACQKKVEEACEYLSSHQKPTPRLSGVKAVLSTIGIVAAGAAAGMSTPSEATDAEKRNAIATAMANAAEAMGDERSAKDLRDEAARASAISGSSGTNSQPSSGQATVNGSGVFNGAWAYNGRMSKQVRLLLTRVPGWECPTTAIERGIPPTVATGSPGQRDLYVAAAVTTAWAMECHSRLGMFAKATENEALLADYLANADALCSNAGPDINPGTVATLSIWGCRNNPQTQPSPQRRVAPTPAPYQPSNEDLGFGIVIPTNRPYKDVICSGKVWSWSKTSQSQMQALRECEKATSSQCRVITRKPRTGGADIGC